MSDQESFFKNTSIQHAKEFDNLCDEFETLCLAGKRPIIEAFLVRVDEAEKQPLLVELVAIEMDYRKQLGESIGLSEYQVRYPGLSIAPLDETFQHAANMNSPAPSVRACKLQERSKPYELDSRKTITPNEDRDEGSDWRFIGLLTKWSERRRYQFKLL